MLGKVLVALNLALSICSFAPSSITEAQQPARVYRIGWLSPASFTLPFAGRSNADTFLKQLHELGYIGCWPEPKVCHSEGQNVEIVVRRAEGKNERLPSLAAELVALKPDVIVSLTTPATRAVKQATATIPIVMVQVSDPLGAGFINSFAHPGGNITGVIDLGLDLAAKDVELAHAVAPNATRIAVLMSDNPVHPTQLKAIQDEASSRGLTVLPTMDRSLAELEQAFATMANESAEALIVLGGSPQGDQAEKLAELAAKSKLPTIYPERYYVVKGGLLSYGPNYPYMYRRAAAYIDNILRGAKPADIPVERPAQLELVINLKAAKALGLTLPPSLILRADELIP